LNIHQHEEKRLSLFVRRPGKHAGAVGSNTPPVAIAGAMTRFCAGLHRRSTYVLFETGKSMGIATD